LGHDHRSAAGLGDLRQHLSIREDDKIYLKGAEDHMMAAEQKVLITKMDRLKRVITILASVSGILLIASTGLWALIGFHS
jgi:hypothetical protein